MAFEFDPNKDVGNKSKHGISLARAKDMKILKAFEDTRFEYGETRYRAFGTIDDKYYFMVFTTRGHNIRVITLFRVNKKDIENYEKSKK